ncbi:hypothetical protein FOZ62_011258, partial [Perkinsus olseni]
SRRGIPPTTTHAANGKRKWEMQNSDLPQAKKLMQSKGAEEYSTSPRVAVRMFTEHARVRYSTEIEKQTGIISRVVGVSCGERSYIMEDGHVEKILTEGHLYNVYHDDPGKDFNSRAFGMSCSDIFYELQRIILPESPIRDVLERED